MEQYDMHVVLAAKPVLLQCDYLSTLSFRNVTDSSSSYAQTVFFPVVISQAARRQASAAALQ
jgi:hypothetical protein